MNKEIKLYLEKFPDNIINLFNELRELIYSTNFNIEEVFWAKLPSYYVNEKYIRLILFKDHINIEASSIINYKIELLDYKILQKECYKYSLIKKYQLKYLK